jgi:hypothetical protein
MRKLLKLVLVSALLLFVGLPALFLICVFGLAALGIVVGVGGAIIGIMFALLKFALMIVLPIALIWWVAKRLMAPERTY